MSRRNKIIVSVPMVVALLALFIFLAPLAIFGASDITNAEWRAKIVVSNNGTAATDVSTNFTLSTSEMITAGMLNSAATDAAITTAGGTDVAFMPSVNSTYPWCVWVPSIAASSMQNFYLYTGNVTGGDIRYFPGDGGMMIVDDASMEPSANFTISLDNVWVDTTATGANITTKHKAVRIYISGTENITAGIGGFGYDLLYDNAANEYCKKDAGAVMPAVGGLLSIEAWFYADQLGIVQTIFSVGDAAAGGEIEFFVNAANKICFQAYRNPAGAYAVNWISTNAIVINTWYCITATYDSGAGTRTNVYVNGVAWAGADGGGGGNVEQYNARMVVGAGYAGAYGTYFSGYIDEVRISDVARTLADNIAAYSGGVGGVPYTVDGNTSSLWHFDENTGATTADETGNNTLTLVNTPTWSDFVPEGYNLDVTAAGISSGEYDISVSANTTHYWINLDGGAVEDIVALGGVTVPNNTANWTVGDDDVTPYIGEYSVSVNGTSACNIVWEYDVIFYDTSGYSNDAIPTFRTASSDADVSASISEQTSLVTTEDPSPTTLGGWTMITEVPVEPTGIYDEGGTSFPWGTEIEEMADDMRLPKEVFLFPLAFGTAILLGGTAFGLTHRQKMGIKGSLLIMCFVIEGVLIIWYMIGGGVIPGWTLIPFGIFAAVLLLWKNPYSPAS